MSLIRISATNSVSCSSPVTHVIVVPGGGPGSPEDNGIPPWTALRAKAAAAGYKAAVCQGHSVLVYCTSAGSMNAPQPRGNDGHVIFESTLIAQMLVREGVLTHDIVCDFMPWDTIGNAWSVRLAVLSIVKLQRVCNPARNGRPLNLDVYISDFHSERMYAAMEWILDLKPHPLIRNKDVQFTMHSIPSRDALVLHLQDASSEAATDAVQRRFQHEKKGVDQIKNHKQFLRNENDVHAFILLGGHLGYRNFTMRMGNDPTSERNIERVMKGVGW